MSITYFERALALIDDRMDEELDTMRKERLAEHPGLTLTGMYDVLEKLKAGATLDPAEEQIKDQGMILILKELHEMLDRLVFEPCGWPADLPCEEILSRLAALNKERAAEEARGEVRWLRPDYQTKRIPGAKAKPQQSEADLVSAGAVPAKKPPFPKDLREQMAAIVAALMMSPGPVSPQTIARGFSSRSNLSKVVATLANVGAVHSADGGETFRLRE